MTPAFMEETKGKIPSAPETYVTPPPAATAAAKAGSDKSVFSGLRVSLIPSDLAGRPGLNLRQALIILAVVLVAETVLVAAGYFILMRVADSRAVRISALRTEFEGLAAETAGLEKETVQTVAFNAQVLADVAALDGHVRWTSFLRGLEQYVLPSVICTAINGDSDTGVVNMDCLGRSYRDVAEQVTLMRQHPALLDLQSSSASARVENDGTVAGVSFSLGLKMKPSAWIDDVAKAVPASAPAADAPAASAAPAAESPASPSLPAGAPVPITSEGAR